VDNVVVVCPDNSFFRCSIDVLSPFLNYSYNSEEFLFGSVIAFFCSSKRF